LRSVLARCSALCGALPLCGSASVRRYVRGHSLQLNGATADKRAAESKTGCDPSVSPL
jgi:hypothetical protein